MFEKIKNRSIALIIGVLIFCLLIVVFVSAWTGPPAAPPDPNAPAPINVSSSGQEKEGQVGIAIPSGQFLDGSYGLTVGTASNPLGIKTSGDSLLERDVSIGYDTQGVTHNLTMWSENGTECNMKLMEASNYGMGIRYPASENKLYLDRYNASTNPTPALTVQRSDGYVGIGTTYPQDTLHVEGDLTLSKDSSQSTIRFKRNANYAPGAEIKYWHQWADGSPNDFGDIRFSTRDSSQTLEDRMIIGWRGDVSMPGLVNCDTVDTDASGKLSCGTDDGGGGGAPADAEYFLVDGASRVGLPNSLHLGADTGIDFTQLNTTMYVSADFTETQQRVSGTCAAGSSISTINESGTVVCETDDVNDADADPSNEIQNVIVGKGLQRPSNDFGMIDCLVDDEVLKYDLVSGQWGCAADETGAGGGVTGTGSSDYVARWTGLSSLGVSTIYDDSTRIGVNTGSAVDTNYMITTAGGGIKAEADIAGQPAGYFNNSDAGGYSLITGSGNVGIGTMTPAQPLHVAGNMEVDGAIVAPEGTLRDDGGGWVRTYGNTGWYNQSHGGGLYMTDSTWLRTYDNKSIYSGSGIIRSDASVRSPIFYDQNNTSYYTNPAGTSNLEALNVKRINLGDGDIYQMKKITWENNLVWPAGGMHITCANVGNEWRFMTIPGGYASVLANVHERPHGYNGSFGAAVLTTHDSFVHFNGNLCVRYETSYAFNHTVYIDAFLVR